MTHASLELHQVGRLSAAGVRDIELHDIPGLFEGVLGVTDTQPEGVEVVGGDVDGVSVPGRLGELAGVDGSGGVPRQARPMLPCWASHLVCIPGTSTLPVRGCVRVEAD